MLYRSCEAPQGESVDVFSNFSNGIMKMTNCHEMKMGETYHCADCGLELQVVNECRDVGKPADQCGCHGKKR